MSREIEKQAFARLYAEHSRALLGYALRRTSTPEDAADVVAEAMLVAWRRRHDVPEGPAARSWLFGVARRLLANQRRGNHRRSRLAERLRRDLVDKLGPDAHSWVETDLLVCTALDGLSEDDCEILRLAAWEGLDPHEIAAVIAVPPTTARTRLHRARGRLREQLTLLGWTGEWTDLVHNVEDHE